MELCGSVQVLLPCQKKMLSMYVLLSLWANRMLGGGHSVCSACCCWLQVVRAFYNFHVLLQRGRVLFLVRSQYGPMFFLFLR